MLAKQLAVRHGGHLSKAKPTAPPQTRAGPVLQAPAAAAAVAAAAVTAAPAAPAAGKRPRPATEEASRCSDGGGSHKQPRTSQGPFFKSQSAELAVAVRSCSLAIDLADDTLSLEQQFRRLRSALRTLKEKPLNFNYIAPRSNGRTLLMQVIDLWCDIVFPRTLIDLFREAEDFESDDEVDDEMLGLGLATEFDALMVALCVDSEADLASYNVAAIDAEGRSTFHYLARLSPHGKEADPVLIVLKKLLVLPGASAVLNKRDPTEDGGGCTPMIFPTPMATPNHLGADSHIFSAGFDFFQRNDEGRTCFEMADRLLEANPDDRARKMVACIGGSLLTQWQQRILPHLKAELAEAECTGLLADLVDLALQYVDGHGPSWEKSEDTDAEMEEDEEESRPPSEKKQE